MTLGRRLALSAASLITVSACGDTTGDTASQAGVSVDSTGRPAVSVWAVHFAAVGDSAAAMRMRDSLDEAGWHAYVRPLPRAAQDTIGRWSVRIAPAARESSVPRLVAAALTTADSAEEGATPQVVADALPLEQWVASHRVNTGHDGQLAQTRWAFSPDREGVLVVEDPSEVENEAVPNGFLFVSERGPFRIQRDSVWDVAHSPDWSRVAYGRAYGMSGRGADSMYVREMAVIGARTGLSMNAVQLNRFSISKMNVSYGFSNPVIEPLADTGAAASDMAETVRSIVPIAGGWRVRWSRDGAVLALGNKPVDVYDNSAPSEWLAVDARSNILRGRLTPELPLASVNWIEGPLVDISVPLDSARRSLAVEGGEVVSADGWIWMRGGASAARTLRRVGPGAALAATRTGRFLVALVPRMDPEEGEPRTQLMVYEIRRQESASGA